MSLLEGLQVVQVGDGLAAAVCGRLFADVGAAVACIDPDNSTHLAEYLNHGKTIVSDPVAAPPALAAAKLIVCESQPRSFARSNTTLTVFAGSMRRLRSFTSRPSDRRGQGQTIRRPISRCSLPAGLPGY